MKRVGILGSRELSYKILQWIVEQNNVNIIDRNFFKIFRHIYIKT